MIESYQQTVLPVQQVSRLLLSLGSLGVSNLDFESNVWNILENHIAAIEVPSKTSVIDASSTRNTEHSDDLSDENGIDSIDNYSRKDDTALSARNNRHYVDLLFGLVEMGVKWKSLSSETRESMEKNILESLSEFTNIPKRSELFSLLVNMGNLGIPYKQLSSQTRKILSDAIVFLVIGLPVSKSLSDVIFSIGNMEMNIFEDFSTAQQHKLKLSFTKQFRHNLHHNKFWKGLTGLSVIGIKWSNTDINLR